MARLAERLAADGLPGRYADADRPQPATRPTQPCPIPVGTHEQVEIRALAEQRVAEANAVLAHPDSPPDGTLADGAWTDGAPTGGMAAEYRRVELDDVVSPGEMLGFVLRFGERTARVETTFGRGVAVARLVTADRPAAEQESRALTGADQVEALIIDLVTAAT